MVNYKYLMMSYYFLLSMCIALLFLKSIPISSYLQNHLCKFLLAHLKRKSNVMDEKIIELVTQSYNPLLKHTAIPKI
ncbi:hypothetical protein GCM10022259_29770 [Aquimarina mytili]